jgi:CRISPR-associated endoribonuclease Cas6
MPSALVLALRPRVVAAIPSNIGQQANAAVLRLIAAADEALATRLHDGDGPKPLTVAGLLGEEGRSGVVHVTPERRYELRITVLSDELERLVEGWTAERIGVLELPGGVWEVEQIWRATEEHPWAGHERYETLAAGALLRATEAPSRWTLEFAAPVTFRRGGLNVPVPLPELVFGSLLERWNAFAPLALPEELWRFTAECLAISRYELRSAAQPIERTAWQIGGVGRCSYSAVNRDRYWLACVETLARFAFYSGVGAGTARGMGRARLLPDSRATR